MQEGQPHEKKKKKLVVATLHKCSKRRLTELYGTYATTRSLQSARLLFTTLLAYILNFFMHLKPYLLMAASPLRSWVDYPADTDFPIQNLPYGVFSRKNGAHQQCEPPSILLLAYRRI